MKGLSGIGAEIEVRLDCNFVYCFMTFFLVTYSQNILIFHQGKIAQINSKRNKNIIQTGIQKCTNTKYVMIFSVSLFSRFKYRHLYFIAVIYYESIYTYFIKICLVVLALQWYL